MHRIEENRWQRIKYFSDWAVAVGDSIRNEMTSALISFMQLNHFTFIVQTLLEIAFFSAFSINFRVICSQRCPDQTILRSQVIRQ